MEMETLKKIWENEYIQTAVMIAVIVLLVFSFWYGTKLILNTQYPALAVASGSMCKPYGARCDGWSHPFKETLHVGDLIIVQGIPARNIETALYPEKDTDGDIVVFRPSPSADGDLIVHRAFSKEKRNEEWYFQTKGDGNSRPDSSKPNIPEEQVIGKVILRVPWIGHIALFMRTSVGIYVITILMVVLVIMEIIIPTFSGEKTERSEEEENSFSDFLGRS